MPLSRVYIEEVAIITATVIFIVSFLAWWWQPSERASIDAAPEFRKFQYKYLVGYLMATMGDWLQGPYIFALYSSYGFSTQVSLSLFVAGVLSSGLLATYLGILADRYGRRAFAMLYCFLYIVSCLAKHLDVYFVLFFGDAMAGLAISLLYCVFDSWLVSEHNSRGFNEHLLKDTYATAIFCNSIVAIIAGEVGQVAADFHPLIDISKSLSLHAAGYTAPFDVAIVFLGSCAVVLYLTWPENKSQTSNSTGESSLVSAATVVWQTPQVLACGIVCALFEGSMFIFVVNWTPALQENGVADPPFGHIFSVYMLMIMLGTRLFSLVSSFLDVERVGLIALLVAVSAHAIAVFASSIKVRFISFLIFEVSVGMYFPMIGSLKGKIVPEEQRSTIYGLFRVPLNAAILFTLVFIRDVRTCFGFTSLLLVIASCAQCHLCVLIQRLDKARMFDNLEMQEGADDLDGVADALTKSDVSVDAEEVRIANDNYAHVELSVIGRRSAESFGGTHDDNL